MSVEIRFATEADAGPLLALRRKIFAESNTMLFEPQEFTATIEDERLRVAHLLSVPNSTYLVAQSKGAPVGFLFALGGGPNRLKHSATIAVGVQESYAGRGIATKLVTAAIEWSSTAGLRRLELTVHTTHLRAIDVYLRCGFQVEGIRRSSLCVDGRFVDEYLMSMIHDVD